MAAFVGLARRSDDGLFTYSCPIIFFLEFHVALPQPCLALSIGLWFYFWGITMRVLDADVVATMKLVS